MTEVNILFDKIPARVLSLKRGSGATAASSAHCGHDACVAHSNSVTAFEHCSAHAWGRQVRVHGG